MSPEGAPGARCPVGTQGDHLLPARDAPGPRLQRLDRGLRIRAAGAARQVLRAHGATTQAGFTAEAIPRAGLRRRPILLADGAAHDAQRRDLGRLFAPDAVERRWQSMIDERAGAAVDAVRARGRCALGDVSLELSVDVARRIVGLTASPLPALARRLVAFQGQPPVDITVPGWGRTRRQWALAAWRGLVPLLRFNLHDVRPAIRDRRRAPRDDVISLLLVEGASPAEILVECVTYATAGMITTRELMVLAAWHLLCDHALRDRYRGAAPEERRGILAEIIRLDPVVSHLYRRVREPLAVEDQGRSERLDPGDVVDLCVRDANGDPDAVGEEPDRLRPGRATARGVGPAGLSFGAGPHRCPGEHLALAETDALLIRLLDLEPEIVTEPTAAWDHVTGGWALRGMVIRWDA